MKISKILSIALLVFVVSALVYDKILLKADSDKIDRTIQFGQYTNVSSLSNFSHVVVKGGNVDGRVELHQRPKSQIRYKDAMKDLFKNYIQNDTLYLEMGKKSTKPYYKNWTNNKVVVLYDSIASFSYENSQNYIYCKKLSNLKIRSKGANSSRLHLEKVDTLDIEVTGNTKLWSAPSKANHLKVQAKDKSSVKLRILTATENNIEESGKAKIEIL